MLYTDGFNQYNIIAVGGCIEKCEVMPYTQYELDYTQVEFEEWWNNKIIFYQDYLDEVE